MSNKTKSPFYTYWQSLESDRAPAKQQQQEARVTGLCDLSEKMGAMPASDVSVCPEGFFQHVIRQGESLITIAQRYNISLTQLMQYNPNINPYFYTTGQILCVPAAGMPSCPLGTLYTIRDGDTLYSIAAFYGTTADAIIEANGWLDPLSLNVGQLICIPAAQSTQICPEGTTGHVISETETIIGLMSGGNFSYGALIERNPGLGVEDMIPGAVICLPASGSRGGCACAVEGRAYRMGEGETLATLAQRVGVDELLLAIYNPMHTPGDFRDGQIICIPFAEET